MNCCRCKCSFNNCIKEHKENLEKEFNELITNWMKDHPEIKRVYIKDQSFCITTSSMFLYPDDTYKVVVHFE